MRPAALAPASLRLPTYAMKTIPGVGPSLRHSSPYLRDESECIARILDVVERNSMMEGLPALDQGLRQTIRRELQVILRGAATDPPGPQ